MHCRIFKFCILFLSAMCCAVNALPLEDYDVSKTWENADVYIPRNFFSKKIKNIDVATPMPIVLFMHGCTGITQEEIQWARFLRDNGYIVVLPNSFAMPNRVVNCSTIEKIPNLKAVPVNRLRPLEVVFAMKQIQLAAWSDKNRIFLMGHSEGAMAVSRTPDMGFKGLIMSGFNCSLGILASSAVPILSISWHSDTYFHSSGFQCDSQWGNRTNGKQILLQGQGHGTASSPEARAALISFLESDKN